MSRTERAPFLCFAALILGFAALIASGCATRSGGGGVIKGGKFPSQQELERIEGTPPPVAIFDQDLRRVDDWSVETEGPRRIEARSWTQRDAWGELLEAAIRETEGGVTPTRAMHCAASEFARLALEQGGRPDTALHRFLIAACNASVANVSFRSLRGEVPASRTDDEIFEAWRDQAFTMVRDEAAAPLGSVVGIAFVRHEGQAALYVARGRPLAAFEPVETSLSLGEALELRGRILGPADSITAAINRGYYEAALCESIGDVSPPAFHFRCEPDMADESAWVSLSFAPPDRLLGKRALDVLVWTRGHSDRVFRRFDYTEARPLVDPAEFSQTFLETLNEVRKRAGRRAVTLDPTQSETATRVAPHYFAAVLGEGEETVADLAALGLIAGWDVEGDIREGGFSSVAIPQTDDVAALVSGMLEAPLTRMTILDPDVERIALGPDQTLAGDIPVLATVVATYSLFSEGAKRAEAEALFARLTEERRAHEQQAPERLVRIWSDAMHSADEVRHGKDPNFALEDLMEDSVETLSLGVSGWYAETSEIEDFEFPEDFLTTPRLGVAIGVSHRVAPDEAWGRYFVLIVSTGM